MSMKEFKKFNGFLKMLYSIKKLFSRNFKMVHDKSIDH